MPAKKARKTTKTAKDLPVRGAHKVKGGDGQKVMTSTLTNIANMKHEQLKGIANNLRG